MVILCLSHFAPFICRVSSFWWAAQIVPTLRIFVYTSFSVYLFFVAQIFDAPISWMKFSFATCRSYDRTVTRLSTLLMTWLDIYNFFLFIFFFLVQPDRKALLGKKMKILLANCFVFYCAFEIDTKIKSLGNTLMGRFG